MLSRLGFVLLAMTVGLTIWADQTGFVFRTPVAVVSKQELTARVSADRVNVLIMAAIVRQDFAEAELYVDIAQMIGLPVPRETIAKLKEGLAPESTLQRTASEFGAAFLTGVGDSPASLAGALSAETTSVSDVRDLVLEGEKFAGAAHFDRVLMGLAVMGMKASEGEARALKPGVALLKVAKRSDMITRAFAWDLWTILESAVDYDRLKIILTSAPLTDLTAAGAALKPLAESAKIDKLAPIIRDLIAIKDNAGQAEALRLLQFVSTPADLKELVPLSKSFGKMTRGVLTLTGARSMRDFKTETTVREAIEAQAPALGAWVGMCVFLIAFGRFDLIGPMPRRRRNPPRRLFRPRPARQLSSFDPGPQDAGG